MRSAILLAAIILPAARFAFAQGAFVLLNERNHPELGWMEFRTGHFRIFYHDPLEPWAREAASILERDHASLCRRLDVTPRARTRVYLSDQDQIANAAAVGWDYIYVWVPSHPANAMFSGSRSWFEEVLVHEYTHILVCWASRTWIGNLAFLIGLYPPRWVHEGVAQWTAEPWSVYRGDLTTVAAILDGSIDRNPPGVPGEGRLLYARGNARIRWLASTHGDSAVQRIIRPAGTLAVYDYGAAERRAFGREAGNGWDRFRRSMIAFYGERYRRGESPDSIGATYDAGLRYPLRVSFGVGPSTGGVAWWTGQARRGAPETSLFRRETPTARQRRCVDGGVTGRPVPLADGRCMIPRFHRVAHGSWVEDLGIYDPSDGFHFLTGGGRIAEADTLSGGRLVAITDSPLGPSLVQSSIPERHGNGPLLSRALVHWPRGWGLYNLAASPGGDRLVISAVGPNGGRALLGIEAPLLNPAATRSVPDESTPRPVNLITGKNDERDAVWLDETRLAWTSHRTGLEEVRTGLWRRGADRIESDSARTAVGTGIEVCGRQRDSLLVLDRTSRLENRVLQIGPARTPAREIHGNIYPFPARPAVDPDMTIHPTIEGPYSYHPLREVRPWLLLPLAGPQSGDIGLGGFGLWAEPLLRHAWGGYVYANASHARDPDRSLFYLTSRWGPWAVAFHSSANLPRRILDGKLLYERMEETGVALLAPLASEADPNVDGWLSAFAKSARHTPRGTGFRTPLGPPRQWSGFEIGAGLGRTRIPPDGAGATGVRRGEGCEASVTFGSKPRGGATWIARGAASAFLARPIPALITGPTLWLDGGLRGASANLPPQEYEGLDANPPIQPLAGWPGVDGSVFLRGWPHAQAARWVVHANAEVRFPVLPDLGLRGPAVAIGAGTLAPFIEGAHLWAGASRGFFDAPARVAYGAEARLATSIGPLAVVPAIAWGRPIGSGGNDVNGSWSVRVVAAVPIAPPLNPPMMFRALTHGAVTMDAW